MNMETFIPNNAMLIMINNCSLINPLSAVLDYSQLLRHAEANLIFVYVACAQFCRIVGYFPC